MHAAKHKRLGDMIGPYLSIAKKHRCSVDAMMAAACTGQEGSAEATAAAAELRESYPAASSVGWDTMPAKSEGAWEAENAARVQEKRVAFEAARKAASSARALRQAESREAVRAADPDPQPAKNKGRRKKKSS